MGQTGESITGMPACPRTVEQYEAVIAGLDAALQWIDLQRYVDDVQQLYGINPYPEDASVCTDGELQVHDGQNQARMDAFYQGTLS